MDQLLSLLVMHQYAAAASVVVLALFTLLSDRTKGLKWESPFRPLLATILAVAGPALDTVSNHGSWTAFLNTTVITIIPTIYAEIMVIATKSKPAEISSTALVTEAQSRGIELAPTKKMFDVEESPTKPRG
jgi:hypothetical protein